MSIVIEPGYASRHRKIVVGPKNRPYLEDRRWIKTANGYEGYYQTKYGAWKGMVNRDHTSWEFHIFRPPQTLLGSDHEACFKHEGNNWWWIHFREEPKNPSDGILAIERLITETFEQPIHRPLKRSWLRNLFGGG